MDGQLISVLAAAGLGVVASLPGVRRQVAVVAAARPGLVAAAVVVLLVVAAFTWWAVSAVLPGRWVLGAAFGFAAGYAAAAARASARAAAARKRWERPRPPAGGAGRSTYGKPPR